MTRWTYSNLAVIEKRLGHLPAIPAKSVKLPKYGNVRCMIDGHRFDSRKEARRYSELMLHAERG